MNTYPASSILAEPVGDGRISPKTLAYVSEAARDQLYDLVVRTCIETGVNKVTLAKRLGKDPSQITRLLGAPGNWTIDTFAQLLFAASGSMLEARAYYPLRKSISNRRFPACLEPRDSELRMFHVKETKTDNMIELKQRMAAPKELSWA